MFASAGVNVKSRGAQSYPENPWTNEVKKPTQINTARSPILLSSNQVIFG
jgi:hypothetical protein